MLPQKIEDYNIPIVSNIYPWEKQQQIDQIIQTYQHQEKEKKQVIPDASGDL